MFIKSLYRVPANLAADEKAVHTNLHYNLIGDTAGTFYPVDIRTGDKITVSRQDGGVFPANSTLTLSLRNSNGSARLTSSLNNEKTFKTLTYSTAADIKYISFALEEPETLDSPLMVVYGPAPAEYVPYKEGTLEDRTGTLEGQVGNLDNAITQYRKTETEYKVFKTGVFHQTTTLFTNEDANPGDFLHYDFTSAANTDHNGYIHFLDSNGTKVPFYFYNDNEFWTPSPTQAKPSTYLRARDQVGRTSVSDVDLSWNGTLVVPPGFVKCEVNCTRPEGAADPPSLTMRTLYIGRQEVQDVKPSLQVPSYYFENNYLPAKVAQINDVLENNMAYGDAFAFITDIHLMNATSYNEFRTPALMNYIGKRSCINKLFIGGDLFMNGYRLEYARTRTYIDLLREGFGRDIYFCVGNHDMFDHNIASRITTLGDAMHNDFNGNSRRHYFYFDNSRAKIRYIVLAGYYEATGGDDDDYDHGFSADTAQQNWFTGTALNMPAGWGAVVFIHDVCQLHYTAPEGQDPTYPLTPQPDGTKLMQLCAAYNSDPSSAGEIIAIVSGHTHCDRVLYGEYTYMDGNTEKTFDATIPVIITTSDQNGGLGVVPNSKEHCDPDELGPRVSGTIREQAFDVMVIDRRSEEIDGVNYGTIYAIRVGCEAYDGTGMAITELGHATQMRTIKFPTKFDAANW